MKGSNRRWTAGCVLATALCLAAAPARAHEQEMKSLATELGAKIQAAGRTRVTVLDFVDLDKKTTKLGMFFAQQLALAFADDTRLEVVDQSQLPELYDQISKLSDGLIDPATRQELGKVTSTEVVIVATVIPSSLTVRIDTKAIDLRTAKVVAARSGKVARLGGIVERLANEAEGIDTSSAGAPSATKSQLAASKTPSAVLTRNDLGMLFELNECRLESGLLTCTLTVSSGSKNRSIGVILDSRAWDQNGAEYTAGSVTIANSTADERSVHKEILKGVPTELSLTFPEFAEESNTVQQLRIRWCESDGHYWCKSEVRSVDLERIPLTGNAMVLGGRKGGQGAGAAPAAGKRGIFGRLGNRVLGMIESVAMERLEEEADKLKGNDEDGQTKQPKKPSGGGPR